MFRGEKLLSNWGLNLTKIWDGHFEDVDFGVYIFSHPLKHQHIREQGGELAFQLHFMHANNGQHALKELKTWQIL